jgi:ribonuclease BN (tRNA processing enzyme)
LEVGDEEMKVGEYYIKSAQTQHTLNSRCYRLTDRLHKSLFYSGDSDYSHNLLDLAAAADLAIIEASNTPKTKIEGHLTPQLAAQVAQEAGIKNLILTHFYPEVFKINVLAVARKIYKGKVKLARDNLSIEF